MTRRPQKPTARRPSLAALEDGSRRRGPIIPAGASARRLAALADASEDVAEAEFDANPCAETARALLRKRAADRLASLAYDREIATRHGLTL